MANLQQVHQFLSYSSNSVEKESCLEAGRAFLQKPSMTLTSDSSRTCEAALASSSHTRRISGPSFVTWNTPAAPDASCPVMFSLPFTRFSFFPFVHATQSRLVADHGTPMWSSCPAHNASAGCTLLPCCPHPTRIVAPVCARDPISVGCGSTGTYVEVMPSTQRISRLHFAVLNNPQGLLHLCVHATQYWFVADLRAPIWSSCPAHTH